MYLVLERIYLVRAILGELNIKTIHIMNLIYNRLRIHAAYIMYTYLRNSLPLLDGKKISNFLNFFNYSSDLNEMWYINRSNDNSLNNIRILDFGSMIYSSSVII